MKVCGAWIPSQVKFLNDFNKSFSCIRQMCHRFVVQLAHGVKRQAEAEIFPLDTKKRHRPLSDAALKILTLKR